MRSTSFTTSLVAIIFAGAPLAAQEADPPAAAQSGQRSNPDDPDSADEILVIAERLRGQVDTDIPPVIELNEEEIAAFGAGSIADLVEQLAPQTASGRGRGGGRPVFLINGQRVSGFREFRRYPPEAIRKVEVLPEEVALRFGYPPDQRVINFILKDNFVSTTVEAEYGGPIRGGSASGEFEGSALRIDGPSRLNAGVDLSTTSLLTEGERGVTQSPASVPTTPGDPDPADFRSLVASSRNATADASWTTGLGEMGAGGQFTLNGQLARETRRTLSGLDTVTLTDAAGNSALRTLDADPITRRTDTTTYSLGGAFNKPLGGWRLSVTADASRTETDSRIDRRRDLSELQAQAAAGALAIDAPLPIVADAGVDRSRSKTYTVDTLATLRGHPVVLPAGEVSLTLDAGYKLNGIDSRDTRNPALATSLDRRRASAGANLGIPLASAREGFLAPLGHLSLDLGGGIDQLSDFGTLTDWNAGLTWKPTERLTLQGSYIVREVAPSLTQLGAPALIDFNVPVFDFARGETVLATITTGGNPNLLAETQRDVKLAADYRFDWFDRASFRVEYFRNHSDNVTESFPLLTPAIEAAFPGRVTRDAEGRLLAIDRRPVTFAERNSSRIRYGINLFGRIGKERDEGEGRAGRGMGGHAPAVDGAPAEPTPGQAGSQGGARGAPDPARLAALRESLECADLVKEIDVAALPERLLERLRGPDGQVDPARLKQLRGRVCATPASQDGEGAPRGEQAQAVGGRGGVRSFGRGRGRGGNGQGRWNLSLYHTIELSNEVLVAPGGPMLDLLNGDALSEGGVSRHKLELRGGLFWKGVGARLSGNYLSGATIDGNGLPGSSSLRFGDLVTFDLRLFANLEQQKWLTGETPGFWKGSRLSLRVNNLLDAHQRVTDDNGLVPLRYQPGLIDPLGRYIEVEFRKMF